VLMSSRRGIGLIPGRKSFLILDSTNNGTLWAHQAPKQSPPGTTSVSYRPQLRSCPSCASKRSTRFIRVFQQMRLIYYSGSNIHVYCSHFEAFSTTSQCIFSKTLRDFHRTFGTFCVHFLSERRTNWSRQAPSIFSFFLPRLP
jgi:hypothetical protein